MKRNVNQYEFEDAFREMGRQDNFSYEGKKALYEWLEDMYEGMGEEYELDVIALCCEYSEHDTALEAAEEYGFEPELGLLHEVEEAATEWLQDRTQVIVFNGGVIIAGF